MKELSTIGIDPTSNNAIFDGRQYKFKIIDTSGQERFEAISESTIKITDGFILVYSVEKKYTLNKINDWLEKIENTVNGRDKVLILVGNKIDIGYREVTEKEGKSFAKENNMKYFETSAKTGTGIKEVFNYIYQYQ